MLTFGKFDTEMDLILHNNLRESLWYCKLIDLLHNPEDLINYSIKLLAKYITEQLLLLSNSQRVLAKWIIAVCKLIEGVIIHDSIPIQEMSTAQFTNILQIKKDTTKQERKGSIM